MVARGSYCLCIRVKNEAEIPIGSLGRLSFSKGLYIYVGSALNSLIPRLQRHLRTSRGEGTSVHWHVDYLLHHPGVEIEAIYSTDWAVRMECEIASEIAMEGKPITRFGCSDCYCVSHLYKVESCGFLGKMGLKKRNLAELLTSSWISPI